jgi:hypothetical protein
MLRRRFFAQYLKSAPNSPFMPTVGGRQRYVVTARWLEQADAASSALGQQLGRAALSVAGVALIRACDHFFGRTSVQQTDGRLVFNLGDSREVFRFAIVIESIQRASTPDAID